ncbi:MAG: cytochrome c [Gammaproteobacteria bacterium]|nr:cytochrome c [Gammaproteobacteria bacterium]
MPRPRSGQTRRGFGEAVKALEDAAAGVLAAYENSGDLGGALRDLGGSCKGCHDEYRSD